MEKYVELEMKVIVFDSEDVITISPAGTTGDDPTLPEVTMPIGG